MLIMARVQEGQSSRGARTRQDHGVESRVADRLLNLGFSTGAAALRHRLSHGPAFWRLSLHLEQPVGGIAIRFLVAFSPFLWLCRSLKQMKALAPCKPLRYSPPSAAQLASTPARIDVQMGARLSGRLAPTPQLAPLWDRGHLTGLVSSAVTTLEGALSSSRT